jgi:hypothetical protein
MERAIREAIGIEFHPDNKKREQGFSLSRSWEPLIHKLNEQKNLLSKDKWLTLSWLDLPPHTITLCLPYNYPPSLDSSICPKDGGIFIRFLLGMTGIYLIPLPIGPDGNRAPLILLALYLHHLPSPDHFTVKMGAVPSSGMWVSYHITSRRHNAENHVLNFHQL